MLGDTYGASYGGAEYDPESPRPNGLFPGNEQRGFGELSAPPPPPPPTMNLPGKSLSGHVGGGSRIPGPPRDVGTSGVAPPLWPPTRLPVTSRPPLASTQTHGLSVSRTSSIQSEGWTSRVSMEQPRHAGLHTETADSLGFAPPPPMLHQSQQPEAETSKSNESYEMHNAPNASSYETISTSRQPLETASHVTNSAMKKPPPAIAKESPLKALYAKGAENYDGSRRRINLKMTLDSVATRLPEMESSGKDEGFQDGMPAAPSIPIGINQQRRSLDVQVSHAGDQVNPQFFPLQQQGGSNQGSSQSFYQGPGDVMEPEQPSQTRGHSNVFNPSKPTSTVEDRQYEKQGSIGYEDAAPHVTHGQRKKKRPLFLRRRFIVAQTFFWICLILFPKWMVTKLTVSGALVQSGLAGYKMIDNGEFRAMVHSQFHKDTTVHDYIHIIESSFNLFQSASESAWSTTLGKITCETSNPLCHWARIAVHGFLTSGMVSQKVMVATYSNVPIAIRHTKSWIHDVKAILLSGDVWHGDNIKSWVVKKSMETQNNGLVLARSTMDFSICTARTSLKSGSILNLSRNILLCCISSYEDFLSTPSNGDETSVPSMQEPEDVDQDEYESDEPSPQHLHNISVEDTTDTDSHRYAEYPEDIDIQEISEEVMQEPTEHTFEDAPGISNSSIATEDVVEDIIEDQIHVEGEILQERGDPDGPANPVVTEDVPAEKQDRGNVPPLDAIDETLANATVQQDDMYENIEDPYDARVPVTEIQGNADAIPVSAPEYMDEPESPDDKLARARRRLEKEKVLNDRKKRREMEKHQRSIHQDEEHPEAAPGDVRSMLSGGDESPTTAVPINDDTRDSSPSVAVQVRETLFIASDRIVKALRAHMTHIATALVSALIASFVFIIQARASGSPGHDEGKAVHTPTSRAVQKTRHEEPPTVYKSAQSQEKTISRRRKVRDHISPDVDRTRQRSKTPSRTPRASSKKPAAVVEPATRRSSRARSTSRKR